MNPISRLTRYGRTLLRRRRGDQHWPDLLGVDRLPIRTILDVGAFDGDTARSLRRHFPAARVHAFEPQPEVLDRLRAWAATQGDAVVAHGIALGRTTGTLTLHVIDGMPRFASTRRAHAGWQADRLGDRPERLRDVSVPVARLDDLAGSLALADPLLIKLDTEGTGLDVIAGGRQVFGRAAACIVEVDLEDRFDDQETFRDLLDALEGCGLRYGGNLSQGRFPDGRVRFFDALFRR